MNRITDIQFVDMVARGIRLMEEEPDGWLCSPEYIPHTDDDGRVFKKPVYYGCFEFDGGVIPWTSMPVMMIPIFKSDCIEPRYHTRCFLEGCEEEWLSIQEGRQADGE